MAEPNTTAAGDFTRLLGADPAPVVAAAAPEPQADARFSLIGVVSPRGAQPVREGVALIAVDGKPARAFRVGAVVDGQTVLQSVQARGADLGPRDGPAQIALRLQPPAPAAVGTLPPPAGLPPMAPAPRAPMQQPPQPMNTLPAGMPQTAPMPPGGPVAVPPGVAPPSQVPQGNLLK